MVGLLGGAASLWLVGGGHGRLELHGARARRRSGGGLDSRTEKIAEKEKTQVDQILIFLEVEYWVLLEMSFFFSLNIFLGVGKHSVFRWKV